MGKFDTRMISLLKCLNDSSPMAPPRGVGLKTMVVARDEGLVDIENLDRRPVVATLTKKGRALKEEILSKAE